MSDHHDPQTPVNVPAGDLETVPEGRRPSKFAAFALVLPLAILVLAYLAEQQHWLDFMPALGLAMLAAALGAVVGYQAYLRVKESAGKLSGRRVALAGFWLSLATVLVPIIAPIVFIVVVVVGLMTGSIDFTMGRPARRRRRPLLPDLRPRDPTAKTPAAADPEVVGFFHEAARKEAASAPVFDELADDLRALRAPASLIARAAAAADDERDHARRCLAAAEHAGGPPMTLAPLHVPARRAESRGQKLRRLAREGVRDGVFGEGLAADIAARAAEDTVCSRLATTWRHIADDERAHAQLAADVVRFCAQRSRRAALVARVTAVTLPRRWREAPPNPGAVARGVPRDVRDLLGPARQSTRAVIAQLSVRAPGAPS